MFQCFRKPLATVLAGEELEEARRQLLRAQADTERLQQLLISSQAEVTLHQSRIARLEKAVQTKAELPHLG